MSSLVLLLLGPVTPKPPYPQDHCDQNKRTDHSTVAAAAPTVAAAAGVAATAARAGQGPDPDASRQEARRLRAASEGRAVQGSPCGSRLGWERRRSQTGPPRRASPAAAAAPAEAARARPPLTFKIRSV